MEAKEYRTIDKSAWGEGPWQDEPDKMQFTDKATGLPCLIVRASSHGGLCGYVGVSEGHPNFGRDYNDVYADVHGGLTFSDFCAHGANVDESRHICHAPAPDEPDRVWWLGFDCAHSGDFSPAYDHRHGGYGSYRNIAYVKAQIVRLAGQLARSAQ